MLWHCICTSSVSDDTLPMNNLTSIWLSFISVMLLIRYSEAAVWDGLLDYLFKFMLEVFKNNCFVRASIYRY